MGTTMRIAVCFLPVIVVYAFYPSFPQYSCSARRWRCRKIGDAAKPDEERSTNSYKFGDLTRGLLNKGKEKLNEITGKEGDYQFGDLSRHLDAKAKERILRSRSFNNNNATTTTTTDELDKYSYQFGDLSRWASHLIKEKAANFSGKTTAEEYQFGDVTKTIVRRVQSGEYRGDDVYLVLRVLVTAGVAILPITNALPIKLLLQLVEADLAKDMAMRMTESLATSLDARFKMALTGKSDYQLGDLTKDRIKRQLTQFTGKDEYEFGDIFRALVHNNRVRTTQKAEMLSSPLMLQESADQELLDWDERFLSLNRNATLLST